jgi:Ankyrin repeat
MLSVISFFGSLFSPFFIAIKYLLKFNKENIMEAILERLKSPSEKKQNETELQEIRSEDILKKIHPIMAKKFNNNIVKIEEFYQNTQQIIKKMSREFFSTIEDVFQEALIKDYVNVVSQLIHDKEIDIEHRILYFNEDRGLNENLTALMIAVHRNHLPLVEFLLAAGANPEASYSYLAYVKCLGEDATFSFSTIEYAQADSKIKLLLNIILMEIRLNNKDELFAGFYFSSALHMNRTYTIEYYNRIKTSKQGLRITFSDDDLKFLQNSIEKFLKLPVYKDKYTFPYRIFMLCSGTGMHGTAEKIILLVESEIQKIFPKCELKEKWFLRSSLALNLEQIWGKEVYKIYQTKDENYKDNIRRKIALVYFQAINLDKGNKKNFEQEQIDGITVIDLNGYPFRDIEGLEKILKEVLDDTKVQLAMNDLSLEQNNADINCNNNNMI